MVGMMDSGFVSELARSRAPRAASRRRPDQPAERAERPQGQERSRICGKARDYIQASLPSRRCEALDATPRRVVLDTNVVLDWLACSRRRCRAGAGRRGQCRAGAAGSPARRCATNSSHVLRRGLADAYRRLDRRGADRLAAACDAAAAGARKPAAGAAATPTIRSSSTWRWRMARAGCSRATATCWRWRERARTGGLRILTPTAWIEEQGCVAR